MPDSTFSNPGSQASGTMGSGGRLDKSRLRLEQAVSRLEKAVDTNDVSSRLGDLRSENAALRDAASTVSRRLDKVIEQLKSSMEAD